MTAAIEGDPEVGVTAAIEGDTAAIERDPEVRDTSKRGSPCWRQRLARGERYIDEDVFFSFHCVEGRSDFHVAEVDSYKST